MLLLCGKGKTRKHELICVFSQKRILGRVNSNLMRSITNGGSWHRVVRDGEWQRDGSVDECDFLRYIFIYFECL